MIHLRTKDTIYLEVEMKELITMPHLGETMESGKIVTVLVKDGDYIKKGDILFEVETDKTVLNIDSFKEGFVRKIYAKPGDDIKVGTPILLITSEKDEPIDDEPFEIPAKEEEKYEIISKEIQNTKNDQKTGKKKILASPLAKKLAREHGVELSKIKGSGPNGEIKKRDIETYVSSLNTSIDSGKKSVPMSTSRRVIGIKMQESKQQIPHFYLTTSIDMSKIKDEKTAISEEFLIKEKNISLSYTDFILKGVSQALSEYEFLNAHFKEELTVFDVINIGVAVDVEGSLLVPVLKDLRNKTVSDIGEERKKLVEKAFQGTLTVEDTQDAIFTISNLGMYDIYEFSAIINPPQVGILAIGKIVDSAVVFNGAVTVRPIMNITLSADHRAIDGAYGAKFLKRLKTILENPVLMNYN